ncbi:unnamed protein product [Caenorhabditis auriculariae]|uniref:Serpentine receptor class gamma n=1 Tax=Caenorhabditis auriculariae TaxID=2777116 RepID=A0A8S1HTT8_9PELO|nr:unnamed protein product [Caenorhabditis auriculariae]
MTSPPELVDVTTLNPVEFELNPELVYVVEHLFFAAWCFTVPFYIFLMFFMIEAQRKGVADLASPFFKICITSGVIDLITLLNNYFGAVFAKWGFFHSFYLFFGISYAHLYLYIAWSTGVCQAMSVSVLATNRLSAILVPQRYQKIWFGRNFWVAVSLQFVPGFIVVGVQLTLLLFFSLKVFKFISFTVEQFYIFYNCMSDIYASVNPYLLLIFSDSLRSYILIRLGLKKVVTRTVTVNSIHCKI